MESVPTRLHSLTKLSVNNAKMYSKCIKMCEKKRRKLPTINQNFFFGCKVKVDLKNYIHSVFVSNALRNCGAVILEDENLVPDITIVENVDNLVHEKAKSGIIIDIQQIPWVNQSPISNEEKPVGGYVVVVDSNHQKRPKYKKIDNLPQMYFNRPSANYFSSPFLQVDENKCKCENVSNKKKDHNKDSEPINENSNPPDCGYCEICMCNFQDAENHRCSKEHSFKTEKNDIFNELDLLINQINEKGTML